MTRRAAWLPPALLAAASLWFFAQRSIYGWTFDLFSDEGGHILGALAIHAGDRLYQDYVDSHGPAVFMLTHLYGVLSGWGDLTYARCLQSLLAAAAIFSIACSPALPRGVEKCIGTALFAGMLGSVWLVQYLYADNYHTIGGTMVVIALALFIVPAWQNRDRGRWAPRIAGFCLMFATGAAYSYVPAILLLCASAVRRGQWRRQLSGLFAGGSVCLMILVLWLLRFGSLRGYVIDHIVINQVYYARYIDFSAAKFLRGFLYAGAPAARPHMIGLMAWLLALAACLWRGWPAGKWRLARIACGFAGIALMNGRGSTGWPDGAFLMCCIGVMALSVPVPVSGASAWPALSISCAAFLFLSSIEFYARGSAFSYARIMSAPAQHYLPDDQPISIEIRRILPPGERMLGLIYDPITMIRAGRLPMKKYHAYLPWEADYARHPWLGVRRDLCADLKSDPPKLIYDDGWVVWNRYEPESFIPCLTEILARDYETDAGFPRLHILKGHVAPAPH